jgi:hypothetical protein
MILPTKHIPESRCILGVGARLLTLLDREQTISSLWESYKRGSTTSRSSPPVPFDWFILALDFLYAVGAVEWKRGIIRKVQP